MPVLLEVCVDSVASALAAQRAGAARVELCCALASGGETPSLGLARVVLARLAAAAAPAAPVPVHVLVRARAGDFCYSADEAEVMLADVAALRRLGVAGVVVGALDAEGAVDAPLMRRLIDAARGDGGGEDARGAPLSVTFHRAIDAARDPLEALRACLALRVDRVLSSGQAATAPQGARVLAKLARLAEEEAAAAAAAASESDAGSAPPPRLVVMAGSGVTAANAAALAAETGVRELHGSARVPAAAAGAAAGSAAAAAAMAAACAKLGFGAQPPQATEESVRAILDALR